MAISRVTILRLRTFGGLALEGSAHAGAGVQPKCLALMALLASAGDRPTSRDKLLAYFWPEIDAGTAAHRLAQTLYALRHDLRAESLFRGPRDIRLNPQVIGSDVQDFLEALHRGDLASAVALYQGPFLEGFYLTGANEFSRWVDEERGRLARRAAEALESLATRAAKTGDRRASVKWWRRLAELDPLSAEAVLGLMRALCDAGERAAAVEQGQRYNALVQLELGLEPDADVSASIDQLRRDAGRNLIRSSASIDPPDPTPAPHPTTGLMPRGRGLLFATGLLVVLSASLMVASHWTGRNRVATETAVAVLPFRVIGATDQQLWREGMVDLLSANLDGAAGIRSVDPRTIINRWRIDFGDTADPADQREALLIARKLEAQYAVRGSALLIGDAVRLSAEVYAVMTHRLLGTAVVQGSPDSLFSLVDRLSVEVLRAGLIAESAERPSVDLRRVTTSSLPALKAYLKAEATLRRGRYRDAAELFRQATTADSTFALAYERMAISLPFWDDVVAARTVVDQALRFGERLSPRERHLLNAFSLYLRGRVDEAEQGYRELLNAGVDDPDVWLQLGNLLVQYAPLRGRQSSEGRQALMRAVELDPGLWLPRLTLSYLAALNEDYTQSKRLISQMPLQHEYALFPQTVFAFVGSDTAAQNKQIALFRTAPTEVVLAGARYVAVLARHYDGAVRIARLLTAPSRVRDVQAVGYAAIAHLELARGRPHVARAALDSTAVRDAGLALVYRALFAALPFLPLDTKEIRDLEDALVRWKSSRSIRQEVASPAVALHNSIRPALRLYLLGLLSARRGTDPTVTDRYADELNRLGGVANGNPLLADLANSVRAQAAWMRGRTVSALRALEMTRREPTIVEFVNSSFYSEAFERFAWGRLLTELGRDRDALDWFGSLDEYSVYDLVYAAPAYLHRAEIYERLGERAAARREYARFLRLWKDCEPELRPMWEQAQDAVARLDASSIP